MAPGLRCIVLLFAGIACCCEASADIAVLLLEATGSGAARYTAAGHSAVYLSGVCPDAPTRLRLCNKGESGSVISNYMDFGEEGSPEWNVSPANVFFYGVANAEDVPIYGDPELLQLLREKYRDENLSDLCPPAAPCSAGRGNWGDMVGATFMRDIYAFRVRTTEAQDEQLVEEFNASPNVNRYSGFRRNCADFTRTLVNRYLPGSVRADWLNDFGMTSPKAAARSFSRYGKRHPELGYSVERYTQIAGPIRRSLDNRNGTEVGFRAKKWSIPLLVARSHVLLYFAASYYLTAWFNPEREYQRYRTLSSPALQDESWATYRKRFPAIVTEAIQDGLFSQKKDIDRYFRALETEGRKEVMRDGSLVLMLGSAQVGLNRRSMLKGDAADRLLAERLMLAKVNATLKSNRKNRESPEELKKDWKLLEELSATRKLEELAGVRAEEVTKSGQ